MRKYFTRRIDPDGKHPYLLVSRKGLAQTARRLFERKEALLVAAHKAAAGDALPEPSAVSKNREAQARSTLSAAYLSALHAAGNRRKEARMYAERARAALVAFAELGVPVGEQRVAFLTENYLVGLAFAYDLVWDRADWSGGERRDLRALFYTGIGDLISYINARHLSNLAAWAQCRVATTAFLFQDEALAADCLEGPDGYARRIAHEFFDDGMSYEQSAWVYQDYSLQPVVLTALAARGAGALPDPLTMEVANDLSLAYLGGPTGNYTMPFYPADTGRFPRPRKKNLHLALAAPFELVRPDTTCPSIGDYGQPTPPVHDHWIAELAWDLYGDRRAARLLAMGTRPALGLHPFQPYLLTLAFGRPLPKSSEFAARSAIFPHAGYAVLKSIEGDGFWKSDAIHAVLKFGPFGNGHGHADKLHLDLAGAGRKYCCEELDRESAGWRYWNSTVSHNTVVVGGRSQPGNEEMFALNDSCGRLLFHSFDGKAKVAAAEAPGVYKGVGTYRRTVALADSYVVDVFEVQSETPTTFDWFLHGKGALAVRGARLAAHSLGYRGHGYGCFQRMRRAAAAGDISARFRGGHRLFVPADEPMEVFTARGPWKKGATRPVFVMRKRGLRALFVAVHDPSGRKVRKVKLARAAGALSLEIRLQDRTDRVFLRRWLEKGVARGDGASQSAPYVVYFQ